MKSSSVSSVASSITMSVIPVMDLIFSRSSRPLNRIRDPFGSSIRKSDRLTLEDRRSPHSASWSSASWYTLSRRVAPTFRITSTFRRRFRALRMTF